MNIVFRAYDDGIAFRYELPSQGNLGQFEIISEDSIFLISPELTQDGANSAWYSPADFDTDETLYSKTEMKDMPASALLNMPLTMGRAAESIWPSTKRT